MNTENFNKTNEELKTEFQKNNEQIKISDVRKKLSYVNQLEYKVIETIAFSLVSYICLLILFAIAILIRLKK